MRPGQGGQVCGTGSSIGCMMNTPCPQQGCRVGGFKAFTFRVVCWDGLRTQGATILECSFLNTLTVRDPPRTPFREFPGCCDPQACCNEASLRSLSMRSSRPDSINLLPTNQSMFAKHLSEARLVVLQTYILVEGFATRIQTTAPAAKSISAH